MRENITGIWLLQDHLNSTGATADEDGILQTVVHYTAFGAIRSGTGERATDKLYTGQQQEYEIGLSYYVARWYDPVIGHFTQPDSIVPGGGDALAWDRYAYVKYNPIKYIDPSGKFFIPPDSNIRMTDGGWHDTERIDKLFDPLLGPYYTEDNLDGIEIDQFYEMIIDTRDAYSIKGIDFVELATLGEVNLLELGDVEQDNNLETMPLVLHLMYAADHSPYVIFLTKLSEETGINYLSGDNWEMNFEPNYLAVLMKVYDYVLENSKKYYYEMETMITIDYDIYNEIWSD